MTFYVLRSSIVESLQGDGRSIQTWLLGVNQPGPSRRKLGIHDGLERICLITYPTKYAALEEWYGPARRERKTWPLRREGTDWEAHILEHYSDLDVEFVADLESISMEP